MERTIRIGTYRLGNTLLAAFHHVCVVADMVLDQQWLVVLHRYCCYATMLDEGTQLANLLADE